MKKELKNLTDKAELQFNFISKPQLEILKTYMELAYNQGIIDTLGGKNARKN